MSQQPSTEEKQTNKDNDCITTRQPAIYVNHGAGPIPYLQHIGSKNARTDQTFIINSCIEVGKYVEKYQPKAICVISAHWEESQCPTFIYQSSPPLYYDYNNFPPESYEIKYPAKCDLQLTDKIINLFKQKGGYKQIKIDKRRGWDHGVFIPLVIALPKYNIPLVQLSLAAVQKNNTQYSAKENLRYGAILSSLRDEGVMIIGSGASFHGYWNAQTKQKSDQFNKWLIDTITKQNIEQSIINMMKWFTNAPYGKDCHPREEHLLPLHVCLGSNMDVESIDVLFEYYEKYKGIKNDNKKDIGMNVNVFTQNTQNVDFCGFAFL
eukprot:414625_1